MLSLSLRVFPTPIFFPICPFLFFEQGAVVFKGLLTGDDSTCQGGSVNFTLTFVAANRNRLRATIRINSTGEKPPPPLSFNRVILTYLSPENEAIFGFGQQYSFFNMKGHRVGILTRSDCRRYLSLSDHFHVFLTYTL